MVDLMPASLHQQDAQPTQLPDWRIVKNYDYRDERGDLLFQVVRMDPKTFRQRTPKTGGGWSWSVKDIRRVLYRLPELVVAETSKVVCIPEGEQDVDRLISLGLVATCNSGGDITPPPGRGRKKVSCLLQVFASPCLFLRGGKDPSSIGGGVCLSMLTRLW